jgi:hypothetical protein
VMPLPAHLNRAAIHALALAPAADIPGVYAVSFLIYDEEDDARRPTLTIGYNTEDRVRQALAGQWCTEPDGNTDGDCAPVRPMIEQITRNFVSLCVRTARRLHDDGIIQQTFGRPVPVLIHELEYYDQIADQTEDANPPGLAEAFSSWIRNL